MFSRLNARAISTLKRSRFAVAALLCLLVAVVSILIIPITRGAGGSSEESSPSQLKMTFNITQPVALPAFNFFNFVPGPDTTVVQGTYDPHPYPCATQRHHFTVGAGKARILVQVNAVVPANDLSVSLLFGADPNPTLITTEDTLTCCEALTYQPSGGVPPGEYQVQICQTPNTQGVPQTAPYDYKGTFTTDDTAAPSGGSPTPTPTPAPTPGPAPSSITPRFYNYAPPKAIGENAGEPSIGYNPATKHAMYIASLQTLRVTFPEDFLPLGTTPEAAPAKWDDISSIITRTRSLDAILFTDQRTGRTFVSQLNSIPPPTGPFVGLNSLMAFSDDDGATWKPAQINPPNGDYDHQTVGAGPYPAALSALSNSINKGSAVYYCAQAGVAAFCSRSDDGGLNFGRAMPVDTILSSAAGTGCGALHGHIKVAPDGTVYLPQYSCNGKQGVAVSTDAGTTWTVRQVPGSLPPTIVAPETADISDPSVAIASDNTIYFAWIGKVPGGNANDNHSYTAVSKDHGVTWSPAFDIGASQGIQNAVFSSAVAGDANRAAVAFLGTTTSGDHQNSNFKGTWYGFVAYTYDGGAHWTTVNATPNGPVQRDACIWNGGGNNPCRNLLDFNDATMDEKGRVLFAFADGCIDGCETGGPNSYSSKATIARQSGGVGLLSQFDSAEPVLPQRAFLSGRRDDMASYLSWIAPDNGGSAISAYKIYRGTGQGTEVYIGRTTGDDTTFNDRSADPGVATYTYKITAVNALGEGGFSNIVSLQVGPRPELTGACSLPGVTTISDPVGDESDTLPQHDITSISMAEPDSLAGNVVFTIKVVNLSTITPGWRWSVRFGVPGYGPPAATGLGAQEDWFVSMTSSDGAAPTFTYGTTGVPSNVPARLFTTIGNLDANSNAKADGTITLVLPKETIRSHAVCTGGCGPLNPGQAINLTLGSVRATAPSAVSSAGGTNETIPDTTGAGSYVLRTSNFCLPNTAPVARINADTDHGPKPLTVNFDGSSSYDNDSIDTIASYTFNFGDGGDDVVQSSPTISHTFTQAGEYVTRLVVNDSRGKVSSNTAQFIIDVEEPNPTPTPTPTPVPTPNTAGPPRFANYQAPSGLGEGAGEPSIGINWKSEKTFSNSMFSIPNGGTSMYYGGFLSYALKVTFNDCASPAIATWEKKAVTLPGTPRGAGDPILFTDHDTGRTLVSQLEGGTPLGSTTEYTDNDGDTFLPSQGSGIATGIDHQTIGGGPYHAPLNGTGAVYPNAIYYCSQSVADASCALSVDGGVTFGAQVPIFTIADCDGLHGHIKVGPDGTAYVPDKGCGGPAPLVLGNEQASIVVSETNGASWSIRPIPSSKFGNAALTHGDDDPSVGVASDGTIYLGYQSLDGHPRIAVSHDKGLNWSTPYDVGAQVVNGNPVVNTTFPAVVAGDGNRAAFAFYGSETGGDNYHCGQGDDCSDTTGMNPKPAFTGVWYLYIASTFDGGLTWTTQNVTPGDPVQRGGICGSSLATCRNLLDFFDMTIDKEGRVVVGWDDGCVGGCVTGTANSFTAKATITRQTGGKRMFAAFDPLEPALPGAPQGTGVFTSTAVSLSWTAPDNGGSAVTAYKVYRKDGSSGSFNLIATVNDPSYIDTTFPGSPESNSYRVTAVNGQGEGPYCANFTLVASETPCVQPGVTKLKDDSGDTSAALGLVTTPAPPGSDLLSLQLAQPYAADGVSKLVFTINTDTGRTPQPPGSAWYVAMRIVNGTTTRYKGVHMAWNGTTPIFESYTPSANTNGGVDGRFVTTGSQKPTEASSTYASPFNKVVIVVKASDLGLNPGDVIDGFVAGVSQSTDPGATVGRGATALYDEMPNGLGFTGTYTVNDNNFCPHLLPSATVLASAPNPSNDGQSVTFTATVSSTSAGTPTGNVAFKDGAATIGSGTLNAQLQASFSTATLAAGNHSITAVYSGDTNFSGSTSPILIQTVSAAPTPTPTPTPTPGPTPPAASFGHNTLADFSAVGGEPFIRVDKQDNVFVSSPFGLSTSVSLLWKSIDHGRTFIPLGTPIVRDSVLGPGGGDTHQAFDAQNRLYYSDLSGGCVTVAVSEDGGNTFPLDRSNVLTCIGTGEDPEGAQDDRQWVAGFGDGIGYMTVRNLLVAVGSGNFHLSKTTDAGKTWHAQIIGNVGQSGNLEVDKVKRKVTANGMEKDAILLYQLYYSGGTLKMFRIADFNDGTPLIVNDLTIGTPGGTVANVFPVMTIDKAGNLYVVWSSNAQAIFMTTSTDRGNTWSAPAQVSPASMTGTNIMPWIVAGDPGRVDVVWYRTPGGNNAQSVWDIHMAQSIDALSGAPAFSTNKVNENTIHTGEICLNGLNCDISTVQGSPRDRSFLEFPSIDIDSKGAAYITYNDSTNQIVAPYVMVARQTGGPSLIASIGSLTEPGGAVTISQPAANANITTTSMTLSGTQALTPKNFDRDDNADAKFPDHGAAIGSNIPALDLKSVSLSDDANNLTVTMQVADLTTASLAAAPAQSGGDGVLYLTQMHSGNSVFWIAAEVRGGVPRFLTGTLGSINSALSKKYITYNPDANNSLSVQGSVSNTAPGTITMKIPRALLGSPANGTTLTSVTGYAFSERGPLAPLPGGNGIANVTSLPIQVDAAGALSYTLGDGGPQFNGVVEISIDDPGFTAPRLAALGDVVNANTWSLQLSGSDLVAGAHTAYVRQRINGGNPSPVVSVAYTVSATIEQSVSSMVSLITANPRSSLGISSYDVSMKNISSVSILAPMRLEVASITSASGTVSVANADNSKTGAGAIWDYSTKLGADNALTANETSAARNLRFNNPRNEAFTVTFNVIGNLDRAAAGGSASSSPAAPAGSSPTSGSSTTSTVTNLVFQITYNPLLKSLTSQLIKP